MYDFSLFYTPFGDVFIPYLKSVINGKTDLVPFYLAKSYCSELIFRLSGWKRFSDELLLAIRISMEIENKPYCISWFHNFENSLYDNLPEKLQKKAFPDILLKYLKEEILI